MIAIFTAQKEKKRKQNTCTQEKCKINYIEIYSSKEKEIEPRRNQDVKEMKAALMHVNDRNHKYFWFIGAART